MSVPNPDEEITGSHEEFWTFSQVSQWGSHWPYSVPEHLNQVHSFVVRARSLGLHLKYDPHEVHIAQILIWRFYLRENDFKQYPAQTIIPLAFESAAQILGKKSNREQVAMNLASPTTQPPAPSEQFKQHFDMTLKLHCNIRIHHPSVYLPEFITPQFGEKQMQLAECIINDSFLCPCCLVHQPRHIAEGAAIMAAGMTSVPQAVIPKSVKAISFIRDMKCFYQQSLKQLKS